ncbi:hypothetical protein DN068_20075 [Taibaiella soli]|uniref:Hyaluronidase n=1 Tax=Taibaiella soli TaxID=1649169 RepID=A0A2W2BTA3_9BACT|nr:hypothetical protein DN068_20075 [Taibaiella soli]
MTGTNSKAQKKFTLFNAIHYRNTPDLTSQSVHKLNLFYEVHLLDGSKQPNDDSIRKAALKSERGVPVTLDIESWSFASGDMDETIRKYEQAIHTFKQANPNAPLGFYGVVPENIIHKWRKMRYTENSDYSNWLNTNLKLKPIADKVDVFFPACYTYTDDTISWKEAVTATIKEIKKYSADKPVYAYIWPQYHGGFPKGIQFIDPKVWKFELETLYNLTDGAVIWSGNRDANNNVINWSESMPWWQVTKDFIREHNIK